MHGNVWEWCYDWSGAFSMSNVIDPVGPNSGSGRVNRGGSFGFTPRLCRSAGRYWNWPYLRGNDLGFRVALIPAY
jgi:formylglycine-generating enzyme required for sulfatase activity